MPWGAVAAAVVGAYSANQQSKAAKKGGDAQAASAQASIDEQRREFDQSRTDQLPWLTAGTGALGQLGTLNSGNFDAFKASPDYKYTLDSSLGSLDRYAASHGAYNSGGADADRIKLAQGLASQNYNNYYNRIANIAGVGQNSAQNLGSLGANMATNIGAQYNKQGEAWASSYAGQSNAWSNYANSLAGMAGQYYGSRQHGGGGGSASPYSPYGGYTYSMNNRGPN